jgi:hypothetical protein
MPIKQPSCPTPKVSSPKGPISANELYPLDVACGRLGWSPAALRSAKRRGLPVHRCGRRAYLLGAEIIAHISQGDARDG